MIDEEHATLLNDLDALTIAMAAALDTIAELREALYWYVNNTDNGDTARAVLARGYDA